jgi:hypothetical protein
MIGKVFLLTVAASASMITRAYGNVPQVILRGRYVVDVTLLCEAAYSQISNLMFTGSNVVEIGVGDFVPSNGDPTSGTASMALDMDQLAVVEEYAGSTTPPFFSHGQSTVSYTATKTTLTLNGVRYHAVFAIEGETVSLAVFSGVTTGPLERKCIVNGKLYPGQTIK